MSPRPARCAPSLDRFAEALLDPRVPPPPALRAWNGADVARRLDVHRNTVVHSLVAVLADTFPVVRELVGADFFAAAGACFVRAHPPTSPLMHRYGERFPDWLAGFGPAAALPYLGDVARLERARLEAFNAADAEPIDPRVLEALLGEPARLAACTLRLHPSLAVIRSDHPVVSLWRAHQHDDATRDAILADVELSTGESCCLVRHGDDALVLPLPRDEADLLASLARGDALGVATAAHPRADVPRLLALLLAHDAITGPASPIPVPPPLPNAHPQLPPHPHPHPDPERRP